MLPSRPRRALTAVVGAVALLIGLLVVAAPAGAAVQDAVVGVGSGRCLGQAGGTARTSSGIDVYDCAGQENQRWTLTGAGELKLFGESLCLDVEANRTTSPGRVQTWTCNGGSNQKWQLRPDGTIRGVGSGLCLDVKGAGNANGNPVQAFTCHDRTSQQWRSSFGGGAADGQAPSAPPNTRISDLTCQAVTFSWDAARDDVGVTRYQVYRDGQRLTDLGGSTLSTRITLTQGQRWGLYVNAVDAAGNVSAPSTVVSVLPPPCGDDTQAPSTPAGVTASASGTSATVRWQAATDDVGVTGYQVFRDGTRVSTLTGTPPALTFTDSNLAADTTYRYTVAASDTAGNVSARSAAASVTTGSACATLVCGAREVATDADIPWGLVQLPDGDLLYTRRDAQELVRMDPATGRVLSVQKVAGVEGTDGEGGLLGLAISSTFAQDPYVHLMYSTPRTGTKDVRVVRVPVPERRSAAGRDGEEGAGERHPARPVPRRRTAPVRAGRQAIRLHRGRRERHPGPEPRQPERQGAADRPRRQHPGRQPLRHGGLELRAPQPAGAGLRLPGPAVGAGVRRRQGRRDQPDHQGRQLRLALLRGDRPRAGGGWERLRDERLHRSEADVLAHRAQLLLGHHGRPAAPRRERRHGDP